MSPLSDIFFRQLHPACERILLQLEASDWEALSEADPRIGGYLRQSFHRRRFLAPAIREFQTDRKREREREEGAGIEQRGKQLGFSQIEIVG